MARGGARIGAGRPPAKSSLSEAIRLETGAIRVLPRTRRGNAPAWPLGSTNRATTSERAMWNALWKKPQAIVWDENQMHYQVAMYVRSFIEAAELGASSARRTLLLQQENVLLLNPAALLRAGYRISIAGAAQPAAATGTTGAAPLRTIPSSRGRLRAVEDVGDPKP